jgi:hypothetical protein
MTSRRYAQEDARRAGIADGWIRPGVGRKDGEEEDADRMGGQAAAVVARKNVTAAFAKNSNDGQDGVGSARLSSMMVSNDSSFVPSEQ